MSTIAFAVVMLHLLAGFGYILYKVMGSGPKDNHAVKP
jgi:hypothetical protein